MSHPLGHRMSQVLIDRRRTTGGHRGSQEGQSVQRYASTHDWRHDTCRGQLQPNQVVRSVRPTHQRMLTLSQVLSQTHIRTMRFRAVEITGCFTSDFLLPMQHICTGPIVEPRTSEPGVLGPWRVLAVIVSTFFCYRCSTSALSQVLKQAPPSHAITNLRLLAVYVNIFYYRCNKSAL
jgi:hypothetical protein